MADDVAAGLEALGCAMLVRTLHLRCRGRDTPRSSAGAFRRFYVLGAGLRPRRPEPPAIGIQTGPKLAPRLGAEDPSSALRFSRPADPVARASRLYLGPGGGAGSEAVMRALVAQIGVVLAALAEPVLPAGWR